MNFKSVFFIDKKKKFLYHKINYSKDIKYKKIGKSRSVRSCIGRYGRQLMICGGVWTAGILSNMCLACCFTVTFQKIFAVLCVSFSRERTVSSTNMRRCSRWVALDTRDEFHLLRQC